MCVCLWQICIFVVGWSKCQCTQQKGVHLLPITHTDTQMQIYIFFGHGCVYSVSVLIIRYLAGGFSCAQSNIKRLFSGLSCCMTLRNSQESHTAPPGNATEGQQTYFLSFHISFMSKNTFFWPSCSWVILIWFLPLLLQAIHLTFSANVISRPIR